MCFMSIASISGVSNPITAQFGVSHQITAQQVTASALKRAQTDGDGRAGAAALNDGDSAATAAARTVSHPGAVNIKA
jgi:hypothetical protein